MQTRLPKTKCVWPMKINVICTVTGPFFINHTKLITKLSKFKKQKTSFNLTFRYIDDVLSLNNLKFNDYIDVIYDGT